METYRQESYGQENYRQESYSRAAYKKPGRRMNTARIMLYTFLSFVLSLIFFVLIVTLLSVGLGTLIIWIGIPILLVAFAMIRGVAVIERSMLRHLLDTDIAEPYSPKTGKGMWHVAASYLRDISTWKTLLYILIKFPFSMVMFWIGFSFLISSISFILFPLIYVFVTQLLIGLGVHTDVLASGSSFFAVHITGTYDMGMLLRTLYYVPVGLVLLVMTHFIVRGFGWLMAELGRVFLSSAQAVSPAPHEEPLAYPRQ